MLIVLHQAYFTDLLFYRTIDFIRLKLTIFIYYILLFGCQTIVIYVFLIITRLERHRIVQKSNKRRHRIVGLGSSVS